MTANKAFSITATSPNISSPTVGSLKQSLCDAFAGSGAGKYVAFGAQATNLVTIFSQSDDYAVTVQVLYRAFCVGSSSTSFIILVSDLMNGYLYKIAKTDSAWVVTQLA